MVLGSSMLELVLGMIFFYFSLSVICSTLNELIAALRDWRGRELVRGVRDLLNDPQAKGDDDPLPSAIHRTQDTPSVEQLKQHLGSYVLSHPMIIGLSTKSFIPGLKQRQPDYVPDRTFSLALIDLLAQAGRGATDAALNEAETIAAIRKTVSELPPGPRRALLPLVDGSLNKVEQLQRNIEYWYNSKMDRVTGVYKRWTQLVLLLLGLLVAGVLNADSIAIATTLWQSPTLREAIADQAQAAAAAAPSASPALSDDPYERSSQLVQQIRQDVQNILVFPVGWNGACNINRTTGEFIERDAANLPLPNRPNCWPQVVPLGSFDGWGWLSKLLGFVITGVAVSMGATFWFDLLGKVSQLRSSGPSPKNPEAAGAPNRTPSPSGGAGGGSGAEGRSDR